MPIIPGNYALTRGADLTISVTVDCDTNEVATIHQLAAEQLEFIASVSQEAVARIWDTPEEDEAWAHLNEL